MKKIINLKASIPSILLVLGIILLGLYYFNFFKESHPVINAICGKVGEIILVSSLVTFLIDSAQYFGVFKKNLEDIIYDSKHLSNRRDIDDIWVRVSKEMFDSKFPDLVKPLMSTIKGNYLPNNESFYYEEYVINYDINWTDKDNNIINVVSNISFTLKTDTTKKITLPLSNTTCVCKENKENVSIAYSQFKVNGEDYNPKQTQSSYSDNVLNTEHKIDLRGSYSYKIEFKLNKEYSLSDDNYIGFKARWLVNKIRIQVFHPEDLNILFIDRGTTYKYNNKVNEGKSYAEYWTKGLLLRCQGFLLILQKK